MFVWREIVLSLKAKYDAIQGEHAACVLKRVVFHSLWKRWGFYVVHNGSITWMVISSSEIIGLVKFMMVAYESLNILVWKLNVFCFLHTKCTYIHIYTHTHTCTITYIDCKIRIRRKYQTQLIVRVKN
jgi:hypothetical protein